MKRPLFFKITIPADACFLKSMRSFWLEISKHAQLENTIVEDMCIVLEENCTNIIRYAYKNKKGNIHLSFGIYKHIIKIIVRDRGCIFDQSILEKAVMPNFFKGQKIGKMGLPLMRELTDEVSYSRTKNGMNSWKLKKNIRTIKKKKNMENIIVSELNTFSSLIKIKGSLDLDLSKIAKTEFLKVLEKPIKIIVVDMEEVDFMASEGLGIFLLAGVRLSKNNGQVWLLKARSNVLKIFKLTRVESYFRFFDSMEEVKENLP